MRSRRLGRDTLATLALAALAGLAGWYTYCADPRNPQAVPSFAVRQEQHEARGYGADSARVDSQVTLRIPDGHADAVYEYLKSKYVAQADILKDRFPEIQLRGQQMSDVSLFTDEYFDTPALDLYKTQNSTRHRTRTNTTNPDDRKSGRELVQVKLTPPGQFTLRNELKYKVNERMKKPKGNDDFYPLLRLIPPDQRKDFKKVYTDAGINPYSLKHVFTIRQTRRRGYLNWGETNIASFSVDEGCASILWAKGCFSSVDLGLVEIAYTEADEARRKKMWEIRDAILQDLQDQFPDLTQTADSKYGIVMAQLIQQIPLIPALFRVF